MSLFSIWIRKALKSRLHTAVVAREEAMSHVYLFGTDATKLGKLCDVDAHIPEAMTAWRVEKHFPPTNETSSVGFREGYDIVNAFESAIERCRDPIAAEEMYGRPSCAMCDERRRYMRRMRDRRT